MATVTYTYDEGKGNTLATRTHYYEVRHHSEEFGCHVCGSPVDVGDKALMVECDTRGSTFPVCSKDCNRRDLNKWREENEPSSVDDFHCYAR